MTHRGRPYGGSGGPDRIYEARSIRYLSGEGTAVEDSCYRDAGATDLDDINDVGLPE